ncbi:thiamine-monophosphate kinase [Cutibacterium acnes JCM 18918]|nr:thiamine-monophosphate kinase [Cutibacterium acnes JCM 18918]
MTAESQKAGVSVVGGDTTGGPVVSIAVTVIGQTAGMAPVRRDGAVPGDEVAVIGQLGLAAAGLALLGRGFRSPRAVVAAQRCPEVPYGQGRVAAKAGVHAMIDVSDGLLADLAISRRHPDSPWISTLRSWISPSQSAPSVWPPVWTR